jgi:peptidoglycan hydrolase-like protein with peptidoglycan-binding domain
MSLLAPQLSPQLSLSQTSGYSRPIQWTFRTLSLILGLLILGFGNAAMALQHGDRGSEVSALQTRLTSLGCYSGEVTGTFGPQTEAGVKFCQQQFNLTADGIAGSKTMAALNGLGSSVDLMPRTVGNTSDNSPMVVASSRQVLLQRGDRGNNVTELQTRLERLGYNTGGIDGIFGGMTEAAVQQLQRSAQLPSDGKFGQQELAALNSTQPISAVPAQPSDTVISLGTLAPGAENSDVTRLQQRLKDSGYFYGQTTAYYGSKTEGSVSSFQRDRGLSITGVADAPTLQALGLRSGSVSSFPPAFSPFNSQGFTSGSTGQRQFPDRPATPNSRYLVVIPKQNSQTLGQVRQLIANAQTYSSSKGDYIAAGSFMQRSDAERRSQNLRAYGLDARVDYQ